MGETVECLCRGRRYFCSLGNTLDTNMPESSVTVINTTDSQGKLQAAPRITGSQ